MAVPVICIVGKKKCGKTTFLEKLLPVLRARGHMVGVLKHDTHGFDMDIEGKDTWRLKRAGAAGTLIASPDAVGMVLDLDATGLHHTPPPDPIVLAQHYFGALDLVLAEGFSSSDLPKIEVFRRDAHQSMLCAHRSELAAVVGDHDPQCNAVRFGLDAAEKVASFIEERWLDGR